MNNNLFIIAGNDREYWDWVKTNLSRIDEMGYTRSQVINVYAPEALRGFSSVHGFFIGSFRERSDIKQICDMICICNNLSYQHKFYD